MRTRGAAAAAILLIGAQAAASSPQPVWERSDALALVQAIKQAREEGLDPADYDAVRVQQALDTGNAAQLNQAATRAALRLAGDYLQGHVRGKDRVGWHIRGPVASEAVLMPLIVRGVREDRLIDVLRGLLPRHEAYRALRDELQRASPSETDRIMHLRVNMERWRWMPRELGDSHVFVNVPAFELNVIKRGHVIDTRPVIVGHRTKATPQFHAIIAGVILNPWWEVPPSIVDEGIGEMIRRDPVTSKARGFVVQAAPGGGIRVRQAPGRTNALGQMKLVMPNPFAVYLHDTSGKGMFDQSDRALSHGCIRVKHATEFSALLLEDDPAWTRREVDRVLTTGASVKAPLVRPLPLYVVYFTAAPTTDGEIAYYGDPYGRDAPVWRALSDGGPKQLAADVVRNDVCPA